MLYRFLTESVHALRKCTDVASIDKILAGSISQLYKVVPEFALYKGSGQSSVEASMHAASATRKYYGIDLSMEEARAMVGAHCFLLSLAGTEHAYEAFVRKQHLVPGRKPLLPFGTINDGLNQPAVLNLTSQKIKSH